MSTTTTIQELAAQLANSVSGGTLVLNSTSVPVPTFGWSLQTMGLTSISISIPDPATGIVYDTSNGTLTITGECAIYQGWPATSYTIVFSSGDSGNTVTYANTAINANYAVFNISLIAGSGLVPANSVSAELLPAMNLANVPMSVNSTSTSGLPNCALNFGLAAIPIEPKWPLVSLLDLYMESMGFQVVNTLNKNGVVLNEFSLSGGVSVGSIEIDITVTIPVGIFSSTGLWSVAFSSEVGATGLSIGNLVKNLGGVNVYQEFPSSLTGLGGFTLTYFYVQFSPSIPFTVNQIAIIISAPDWTVIEGQFCINNTSFSAIVLNPFNSVSRNTTFYIAGDFLVVDSNKTTVATLSANATLPLGGSDWFFNVSGEITNVNYNTLAAASPGTKKFPPPAAPNGFELEQITLNFLNISYNPTNNNLSEVDLSVTSIANFPVVPGIIGVSDPYFSLSLTNPLSDANNDYAGTVGGTVTLINAPFLELQASLAKETGWAFRAELSPGTTINIIDLLDQFFSAGTASVPSWVGDSLEITAFKLLINTPPSGDTTSPTEYNVSGTVAWHMVVGTFDVSGDAVVEVDYKTPDVSGSITLTTTLFGLDFLIGYKFAKGDQSKSQEVFLVWNGITADYSYTNTTSTYSLTVSNLSLGGLITSVMSDIIPGFTLTPPWNLLNDINLDGLSIVCTQDSDKPAENTLVVNLPININLGFIDIKSAILTRTGSGSGAVTNLGFTGSFLGFPITTGSSNPDAAKLAGSGAPVNDMPGVPGMGSKIFDLQYFGLGQHVALYPTKDISTVKLAVSALEDVFKDPPTQQPGQLPVIPIPPKPSTPPPGGKSVLIFDGNSNWLIGLQCTIMQTVNLGVVFNDPNLYGLAISLSGKSAGIFDGLDFEILYKKINDSIGMYQLDLQLPTGMRTIELGEVSITLPSASIQIYTNGNFMVDLGFPWNSDFTRSFTIQAFPFIGQGGFYFGVLSSATCSSVPTSQVGSFNPVIELGVGLSLGVGKTINEGIMSAGLSLMAVGVFQGVIAKFNTNSPSQPGDGEYYFLAKGTFGLTGRIYGSINFAIISASFDITAFAYITITIESYNLIDVSFTAGVSVSVTVTVNLGIFKIHVTLKFSTTISASFTIGTNNTAKAPWNLPPAAQGFALKSQYLVLGAGTVNSYRILWTPLKQDLAKTQLNLMYLPLLSLSGVSGTNQAQFINLLFIDAPDPEATSETTPSAFTLLSTAILQWAINAIVNSGSSTQTTVSELMGQSVTLDQLNAIYCYLTYESEAFFPIMYSNSWEGAEYDIRAFLENYFTITLQPPPTSGAEPNHASVFPIFPDLMLASSLNSTPVTSVDFSANPQPFSYLEQVQEQLQELTVQFQSQTEAANDNPSDCPVVTDPSLPATPPAVSFSTFIIQDYFEMMVKNLVQDAIDAFSDFKYPVDTTTTLGDVVTHFTNPPLSNNITAAGVVKANATVALNSAQPFNLAGIVYPVAAGDSFNSIVATYNKGLAVANQLTASNLGTQFNAAINGLIVKGTVITVTGFQPYTVIATDTLNSIAKALLPVTGSGSATVAEVIEAVAEKQVLAVLCMLEIPTLVYTTGLADNFESLAATYGLSTATLAEANLQACFATDSLSVPGLTTLGVKDIVEQVIVISNINTYASMTARFLLYGLNLPDPNNPTEVKPLYVLTGQQIEVPVVKQNDNYDMQLSAGPAGSWIGLAANPLVMNVDNNEISRINDLIPLTLTQNTSTQPPAPLKMYMDAYQAFTLKSNIPWQYPGALTLPVGTPPAQVVGKPSLWYFPDSLCGALQDSTANLELELLLQTLNADGNTYTQSAIQNYGWSTLVNIGVEQIKDDSEQAPVFANSYNLSGASGGDIVFLERLVAALNSGKGPLIDQIRILYDPNATGNASTDGLQCIADGAYEIGVVKVNLSTETNPESGPQTKALLAMQSAYTPPEPNTMNTFIDFLSFIWECSIVRSGGFYLYFHAKDGGAGLPESLFSANPMASLFLLVTYQGAPSGDYLNAVAVGDPIDTEKSVLFVQADALKTRNAIMPPGTTGFQLTIDNPGPYIPIVPYPIPATPQSQINDMLFLQNQFNLVSYQLLANNAFNASPESLMPSGPMDSSNPGDPPKESSMDQSDNWPYQGTLPVYKYAKNKVQPADPSYPPSSADPYSGTGSSVQVQLSLVDLFGNPIASNISGAQGVVTAPINYTDNLVPISQWPGITPRYSFPATDKIQLDLCFDVSRYAANPDSKVTPAELAQADMGVYSSIYYQLIQPGVTVSYRTSLYNSAAFPDGVPLTPNFSLSAFAGTIYAYLVNIAGNKPQTVVVPVPWSVTSEVTASNMLNIFELVTDLTISRPPSMVSPDFVSVPAVTSVTTIIRPITQASCACDKSTSATLTYFATQFEDSFAATPVAGAYLKIASGVDSGNVSTDGNNQKVWVVRFDKAGKTGINVAFTQDAKGIPLAYYYSPAPLSTSLVTLNNTPISPYISGKPFVYNPTGPVKNFAAVDLDQWALVCLQAIDNFLSPQFSVPAFLLDNGQTLQTVLDAKELLANYITGTVTNILDQPLDQSQVQNAQEVFNQQLLISLGNAYNISAIVQHPLSVNSEYSGSNIAPNNTDPVNPRLYGTMYGKDPEPVGSIGSNTKDLSDQYSFTNSKIPLGAGSSWVNYCLYVKDAAQVESFRFSSIDFVLSNIEHQIENVPNVEGYQASTWLVFTIPIPSDTFNTGGVVDMPVPLRAYPVPPSVTLQSAIYDPINNVPGGTTTIPDALQWGFNYAYSQQEATQDIIEAQVAFNTSTPATNKGLEDDPTEIALEDALAQFIAVLPALTNDFLAYVAQVTPADVTAKNTVAQNAKAAVESLGTLSNLLAIGWKSCQQYHPWPPVSNKETINQPMLSLDDTGVVINYSISETESIAGDPASPMIMTVTAIGAIPAGMVLPVVSIEGYQTITLPESTLTCVYYMFELLDNENPPKPVNPSVYLSYADRQIVNTRNAVMSDLNLMQYQEGWAGLQITRNLNLVKEYQTNQLFLYQTPLVRFYTPLTPLLSAGSMIDISAINTSGKPESNYLAVQLQNLFNAIFTGYSLRNPTIRMEALYSYNLNGNAIWNQIDLPVFLALPFVLKLPDDLTIGSAPPYCTASPASFLCTVSTALLGWFKSVNPNRQNGQFTFKLIIYSASDNTTPLITMTDLSLAIDEITELNGGGS